MTKVSGKGANDSIRIPTADKVRRAKGEDPKIRYATTSRIGSPLEIINGLPCVSRYSAVGSIPSR